MAGASERERGKPSTDDRQLRRAPNNMSIRLVVTGCPRSGTKYTTEVFKSLGLKAGHEECFTPEKHSITGCANEVEASWLAAPFLASLPANVFVIHQVRNPISVIRSLVDGRHLSFDSSYSGFVYSYLTSLPRGSLPPKEDQKRAEEFWMKWNWFIECGLAQRRRARWKVEDVMTANIPPDCNTWGRTSPLVYPLQSATITTARRYGYTI